MSSKKTSIFENGLIWFGAAASLAEILAGTAIAPLGFQKGFLAIIIGHIIGCALLFLAGLIGGKTEKCAMETVKMSFGKKGSLIFAILNIIQLIGWTSIMIYDGAIAANGIFSVGNWLWAIVIGALIILWICVGIENLGKLNTVAMTLLFALTIVLSVFIFRSSGVLAPLSDEISFGAAVELSVAMPLSWLPLISDYTKDAEKPVGACISSSVTYFAVSCWMYVIGMGATIFAGTSNIVDIILKSGIGVVGLLIVLFSTVTTTFLDAFSAGVSSETVSEKLKSKYVGIVVTLIGVITAIIYPLTNITDFLYLIGSVFAPMIAVQIADYFILKRDSSGTEWKWINLVIWLVGFICYRVLMRIDIVVGNTLPSILITILVAVIVNKVVNLIKK